MGHAADDIQPTGGCIYIILYGNEATLDWIYGDVCLVVRIGKAGDRLAYLR